jgi:hypothetical protein
MAGRRWAGRGILGLKWLPRGREHGLWRDGDLYVCELVCSMHVWMEEERDVGPVGPVPLLGSRPSPTPGVFQHPGRSSKLILVTHSRGTQAGPHRARRSMEAKVGCEAHVRCMARCTKRQTGNAGATRAC